MAEHDPHLRPESPRSIFGTTPDGKVHDFTLTFDFEKHPLIQALREAPVLFDLAQLEVEQAVAVKTSILQLLFYRTPDEGLYFRAYGKTHDIYGQVYDCQEINAGTTIGREHFWEGGTPQIKKDCYLRILSKGAKRPYVVGPIIDCTEPIPNIEDTAFWEL